VAAGSIEPETFSFVELEGVLVVVLFGTIGGFRAIEDCTDSVCFFVVESELEIAGEDSLVDAEVVDTSVVIEVLAGVVVVVVVTEAVVDGGGCVVGVVGVVVSIEAVCEDGDVVVDDGGGGVDIEVVAEDDGCVDFVCVCWTDAVDVEEAEVEDGDGLVGVFVSFINSSGVISFPVSGSIIRRIFFSRGGCGFEGRDTELVVP
jgi:hypothetical protein